MTEDDTATTAPTRNLTTVTTNEWRRRRPPLVVLLLPLLGLAGLVAFGLTVTREGVEADLLARSVAAMADAGFADTGLGVDVRGRDVVLLGSVADPDTVGLVSAEISRVAGVRAVSWELDASAPPASPPVDATAEPVPPSATPTTSPSQGTTATPTATATPPDDATPTATPTATPSPSPAPVPDAAVLEAGFGDGTEDSPWVTTFDLGQVDVTDATGSVEEARQVLAAAPTGSTVLLVGHADSSGDAQRNEEISLERAEAVADALREAAPGLAYEVSAVGESEPLAELDATRRVEYWLVAP